MALKDIVKTTVQKKPYRMVIAGVEGVGKSTAGANSENPIFLCFENGLVGNQFEGIPHYEPQKWGDVLEFLHSLKDEKHEYKTLVIDTLDQCEMMINNFVCARDQKKNIEDYGYGKGYVIAKAEFDDFCTRLDRIKDAGMSIIILAHVQIKPFSNPAGDNYDRYELKANKHIAAKAKEWADVVLFAQFETYTKKDGLKVKGIGGTSRVVYTSHCAAWDAKNRYSMPEVLALDMSEILNAINQGQSQSDALIIDEIKAICESLPVAKKNATLKWLESKHTNQQLHICLNKVKSFETINNPQGE